MSRNNNKSSKMQAPETLRPSAFVPPTACGSGPLPFMETWASTVSGACILLLLLLSFTLNAQEKIWKGTGYYDMSVTMTEFLPEGEPEYAVVVCPGGSYHWLDWQAEGIEVAKWLASEGIAAYVLKYRTAGKIEFAAKYRTFIRGHRHPDMISDLQRAIQLVKEKHPDIPIGAMGFSAGGHLVMSAGEYFGTNFLAAYGIYPEVSLRPDFVAPIYPVVTLSDNRYAHTRSRLGLLGEWTVLSTRMRDSLSLEKHVKPDTPPVFLFNCVDDPIVKNQNSELLDSALTAAGVSHVYIQKPTGGHGFGAQKSRMNYDTCNWQESFINWLHSIKF